MSAGIGLCLLDDEGAIVELNETAASLLATTCKLARGMQFGDAFHCENSLEKGCGHSADCRHCPVRKNLEAALAEDDFTGDFLVKMKSDISPDPVWLKVNIHPSRLSQEKRLLVALKDVTDKSLRRPENLAALEEEMAMLDYERLPQEQGRLKILIAEDRQMDRDNLVRLLKPFGKADVASDGQEAVDKLMESVHQKKRCYDLVVVDLMLPRLDGQHIISLVRSYEKSHHTEQRTAVLVSSAITDRAVIEQSFELGADAYVAKPLSAKKLAEAMEQI